MHASAKSTVMWLPTKHSPARGSSNRAAMARTNLPGLRRSVSIKLALIPISAASGALVSYAVSRTFGATGFGVFALITALPSLLPMPDLGVGGVVTDAVARRESLGPRAFHRTLRSAGTKTAIMAAVVLIVSLILFVTGQWQQILGTNEHGAELCALLVFSVFAIGIPGSLGFRMLIGAGRNDLVIIWQTACATIGAAGVGALAVSSIRSLALYCLVFAAGIYSPGFICLISARKRILGRRHATGGQTATAVSEVIQPNPASVAPGPSALSLALVSLCLPIAFQTDRLILGHVAGTAAVATYAAVNQLFSAQYAVVAAGGQSLWPIFTRMRVHARRDYVERAVWRYVLRLGALGLAFGCGTILLGRPIARILTDGRVAIGALVLAGFALLIAIHAIHFPLSMSRMDRAGARLQAICALVMVVVNVPLSVALAHRYGAAGPVIASGICIALFMSVPLAVTSLTSIASMRRP